VTWFAEISASTHSIFLSSRRTGILKSPSIKLYVEIPKQVIGIIQKAGNSVNILTKGGMNAAEDFPILSGTGSKVGATLTFFNPQLSREWEHKAAVPRDRVAMLEKAKQMGIETWASIEPVIIPKESLWIMELAIPYVDTFKIGKLNHHPLAKEIDWLQFIKDAEELCQRYGKKYVLKQDLLKLKEFPK